MAVLPGSLDYLYYNGILDHIPYEAYEMTPSMANSQPMNATQYLEMAKQGLGYNSNSVSDSFVRSRNNYSQSENVSVAQRALGIDPQAGRSNDFEVKAFSEEEKNIRQSLTNTASSAVDKFFSAPSVVKGIVGLGVVAGTLYMLLKGKKKPEVVEGGTKNWVQKLMFWRKKN